MRVGDNNVKALFRQGQAHMVLNDVDVVVDSLEKALQLSQMVSQLQACLLAHT